MRLEDKLRRNTKTQNGDVWMFQGRSEGPEPGSYELNRQPGRTHLHTNSTNLDIQIT